MIIKKPLIDETTYIDTLDNGLEIYLHPKQDFIDFHVSLMVKIGGETIRYSFDGQEFLLPAGTAHFIEHAIFENHGKNISDIFYQYNADINASTSKNLTKYYFSVQDHFEEVLLLFLNHFAGYNIAHETIEKERNIILKEVKMYEDNLFYKGYDELMKMMFCDPMVWEDIAGTVESVNLINEKIIRQTIDHFYHPSLMKLVITGPFEVEKIIEIINQSKLKNIPTRSPKPQLTFDLNGSDVHDAYLVNKNQSVEYFYLGVKIDLSLHQQLSINQKRLAMIMFFDYYFSESSEYYQQLKNEKLINYSFYQTIYIAEQYGYFVIGTETKNPKRLNQRLRQMLDQLGDIDETLFIANKRSRIGHFIGYFESSKSVNKTISDLINKGVDFSVYMKSVDDLTINDLLRTKSSITEENIYTLTYAKK